MFRLLLGLLVLTIGFGCTDPNPVEVDGPSNTFDRGAMLANWIDNVSIPSHQATLDRVQNLQESMLAFRDATDNQAEALATLRSDFQTAYLTFQRLSPVIGAEGEAVRLREEFNTYPADTEQIKANLQGDFNLQLPSSVDVQGFPALEYLLYATDEDGGDALIASDPAAQDYAVTLLNRMTSTVNNALIALENNRDAYVDNDGNSATASVDRTVNDFVFYYEKFLRAGKVGIPAGVFSDMPLADRVEGLYAGNSIQLFTEALTATENFVLSQGLADYLDALEVSRNGELLSQQLRNQFAAIRTAARGLNDNFGTQVEQDNRRMLQLYDEMQRLTILLKVDMLQALNINVDYTDADGD